MQRYICLQTLQGHSGWILSIAFSPDGQWLASGSCDRTVKIWSVQDGQCIKTLKAHTNWVWSVAFSPDGQAVASASDDGVIKLWHWQDETCPITLRTKRLYEGMNLTGAAGLSFAQKASLKALGAVELSL
jgi:WD40 repeat protein